jgi:YcxB-like protein
MLRTYKKNAVKFALTLIGIAAIVACVIAIFDWNGWLRLAQSFGILLLIYAVLMVIVSIFFWLFFIKWRTRKNLRQMAALRREQSISWNESAIEMTSSQGMSCFPYDEIHQWAANDTAIIVYPADYLFFAFPSRIFESEEQRIDLIAALSASPAQRI